VALRDDYLEKYYLKTLSNIKQTDTTFSTDEKIDDLLNNSISIWFKADIDPFTVKLYADVTATKYFKRRPLPTQSMESVHQDGTMEFTLRITDEMEIIPIVKYWVPHLRVLEPLWIGEMIDDDLQNYLMNRT
jgi:predicted DNA-binding transcriptional regulator YafY